MAKDVNFNLSAVGVVHSILKSLEDCPRQEDEGAPEAVIEIFEDYLPAAANIRAGDRLMLLTWLDKADRSILKTHPRNDPTRMLTGIFSTRSPDRPNPIGLHQVTVTAMEEKNRFTVSALEALDGTPVLDIKVVW